MEALIWVIFGFQIVFALLFILGALFWISVMLFFVLNYVPWVPTKGKQARDMLDIADVKEGEKVLDLGCGIAHMLVMAAKDYGATGIGYDINPMLVASSRVYVRLKGVKDKVKIHYGNITKIKIPQADVVTVYLYREINKILGPRLKEALPAGTRIVSRTFQFPDWTPKKTIKIEKETYYLYEL